MCRNQCWTILDFYEEPPHPIFKNRLNYFDASFTHKLNLESSFKSDSQPPPPPQPPKHKYKL
jgi:hypothetical protein